MIRSTQGSGLRQTHTYALLELSPAAYDEIKQKLEEAGYQHAMSDGAIDMHGLAVTRGPDLEPHDLKLKESRHVR